MFRILKSESVALVLLVSALCLAGPAVADDPPSAPAGETVAFDTPTSAGIPAEQEAALRAFLAPILNRSDEGLVPVVAPDGSVSLDPQGRLQHVVLVRVGEDGRPQVYSFDELEPAMRFLTFETPTPLPANGETAAE
jgi:hypothetical protein